MRRAAAIGVVLVFGVVGPGACGGSDGPPVSSGASVDGDLFDVAARAVGGGDVELAGYAGRDVIVWFWSPW
jgi:hypothetical protein